LTPPSRHRAGGHAAQRARHLTASAGLAGAAAVALAAVGILELHGDARHAALLGALMLLTLAGWRRRTAQRWALGADGERRVARRLRRLQRRGWVVLHDVDRGRGNVDHIAIGPGGVFTIETKLTRAGASELAQAHGHARWAAARLGVPVTAVLCVTNRRCRPRVRAGVWCVDSRRLAALLASQRRAATIDAVTAAARLGPRRVG
jgi:hypothetical protein